MTFKQALQQNHLSIIAEIKRQSPSKGFLGEIADPIELAGRYIKGGADAISVLTNKPLFNGSLDDLKLVSNHFRNIPTLRKDFITELFQIDEAIHAGASAVLLIVRDLGNKTKLFIDYAKQNHIETMVEIFTHEELKLALDSGAEIININNRNLKNFTVNTQNCFDLKPYIPKNIITVAASGILDPQLARDYYKAGFDAVLIGEALVKSAYPEKFIRACHHKKHEQYERN